MQISDESGVSGGGEESQVVKKILIIGLPLLLLLAGGGAAAYVFLLTPEDQGALVEAIKFKPKPGRYEIDPFAIAVFQGGKVTHHLTMTLALNLANKDDIVEVESRLPLLKDRILTRLHGLYDMRIVRELGFDSALIRDHLLKVLREALPSDVVVTGIDLEMSQKKRPAGA